MRKSITQKDQFGCGIACTAFVLGIDYKKTITLFKNGKKKSKNGGFLCREIVGVLGCGEYKYAYIKERNRKSVYKDKTIVFIKKSKQYPFGHYLVRLGRFWMDPWINFGKSRNILKAKSGFRKRIPGRAIYFIIKEKPE